jgi:hypothetical protein
LPSINRAATDSSSVERTSGKNQRTIAGHF